MRIRRIWVAGILWEMVAFTAAWLTPHTFPGGAFDQGRFWGVFILWSAAWWAAILAALWLVERVRQR